MEFSSYVWRRESHYSLRKDILDKITVFPGYDAAAIEVANLDGHQFDTLEDCYLEILECKNETTLIKHTQTITGNEQWDVPKIHGVDADKVKRKLKKDRFTSLLLANWGCRIIDDVQGFKPNSGLYGVVKKRGTKLVQGMRTQNIPINITKTQSGRKIFRI
jgi:hypothetical protein